MGSWFDILRRLLGWLHSAAAAPPRDASSWPDLHGPDNSFPELHGPSNAFRDLAGPDNSFPEISGGS